MPKQAWRKRPAQSRSRSASLVKTKGSRRPKPLSVEEQLKAAEAKNSELSSALATQRHLKFIQGNGTYNMQGEGEEERLIHDLWLEGHPL